MGPPRNLQHALHPRIIIVSSLNDQNKVISNPLRWRGGGGSIPVHSFQNTNTKYKIPNHNNKTHKGHKEEEQVPTEEDTVCILNIKTMQHVAVKHNNVKHKIHKYKHKYKISILKTILHAALQKHTALQTWCSA